MKKYVIKEIYNDDNYIYYESLKDDLILNFNESIFIGGNSQLDSINYDLIRALRDDIYDYSSYTVEYYYKNNLAAYIIESLKHFKRLSLKQALKIVALLKKYTSNYDIDLFIIESLQAMFNTRFEKTVMRGYCQSDWIYCYYAIDEIQSYFIQYIEAVLFNTGKEVFISNDMYDIDNIDIDDIDDGYYDYIVDDYDIDFKKERLASISGYDKNDIALYTIKDIKTYTTHKIIYDEVK